MYIASPFFNAEQSAQVTMMENYCKKNKIKYFSPRSTNKSKNYSKLSVDSPELGLYKYGIFTDNVRMIDREGIVLANPDNFDSGTLFEVGYALGKDYDVLPAFDSYKSLIESYIDEINAVAANNVFYPGCIVFIENEKYSVYRCNEFQDTVDNTYNQRINVVAESASSGKYKGLSKVLLGYIYASRVPFNYFDVARKSNIMLTSAGRVFEASSVDALVKNNFSFDNMKLLVNTKDD